MSESASPAGDVRSVRTDKDDHTVYEHVVELLSEETDVNDMSPQTVQQAVENVFGESKVSQLYFEQLGGENVVESIENGRTPAEAVGEAMTGVMHNSRRPISFASDQELQESRETALNNLAENMGEFVR